MAAYERHGRHGSAALRSAAAVMRSAPSSGWQMTQTLEEPPPAPLLHQKEYNNGR